MVLSLALMPPGVHHANAAPAAVSILPPACRTISRIERAPIDHAWVVVMNFRVRNTLCVLVYDKTSTDGVFLAYQTLPNACEPNGDVEFANGRAFFRGGYISCTLNIKNVVNGMLGAADTLTETSRPDGFYLLGRGVYSPPVALSTTSAIVAAYDPAEPNLSSVALRLTPPLSVTDPTTAAISAFFNNNIFFSENCATPLDGATRSWTFTRSDGNIKFWSGSDEVCAAPRSWPAIRLWLDGGTLFIGGRPSGSRFFGMLEEVVLDPQGGTSPPKIGAVRFTDLFLPVVARP